MNSSRLLAACMVSLLLHAVVIFMLKIPENRVKPIEAAPTAISVSMKVKAAPAPPPVTEQPSKPLKEPAASAPARVPTPRVEPAPEPEPAPDSISIEKENIAPVPPAAAAPAPDPAPTPAATATATAAEDQNPFNGLIERINMLKDSTYPLIAKKKGWQGSILVQAELDKDGRLVSAGIISECRYSSLNDAALKLVKKALEQPYPHNTGKTAILRLPITYKLH